MQLIHAGYPDAIARVTLSDVGGRASRAPSIRDARSAAPRDAFLFPLGRLAAFPRQNT